MMGKYRYKDSGIELLGDVPEHWKVRRLKTTVSKINSGVTPKGGSTSYVDEGIPLLRSQNIGFKGLELSDVAHITAEIHNKMGNSKVNNGDVLLNITGASLGRCCPVKNTHEANVNQHVCILRPFLFVTTDFLFYLLMSDIGQTQIFSSFTGSGREGLNFESIKKFQLPLPIEKEEQKAIAEYLDNATAKIDRIIEIKEKQLEKIKSIRKSKIDEVVKFGLKVDYEKRQTEFDYLPEINSNWKTYRFKDLVKLRTEKTDEKSSDLDYLELEDIEQGTGNVIGKRDTLEVESKITLFYKGDVIFGKLRPYLEKYHYADFNGKCTGEILAFEPKKIESKFLMYILGSKWFIDLCNSMSYGAKMPRVNWSTQLAFVNLPLPSKKEQCEIIDYLDSISTKIIFLIKKVNSQIVVLKSYRKSLIHEVVTGKKQVYHG